MRIKGGLKSPVSYLWDQRETFRRIPALLAGHPEEAEAARRLAITVDGEPTSAIPQCAIVWRAGMDYLASSVFLSGTWALTARHALRVAGDYHVTLPVLSVGEIQPSNSFHVVPIQEPHGADLVLLRLELGPLVDPLELATAAELQQDSRVLLCGFGPKECQDQNQLGFKRLTTPQTLLQNTTAKGIHIDPGTQFVVDNPSARPLVCESDSGGGAFVEVGGRLKLAGIITEVAKDSTTGNPLGVICVRLSAFAAWISQETGIAPG